VDNLVKFQDSVEDSLTMWKPKKEYTSVKKKKDCILIY
jgi:hypothetical protein